MASLHVLARLAAAAVLGLVLTAAGNSGPARALAQQADLVRADLLAEPSAVKPGEPFWVAVRLRMKEHWHTYWRNPGDSGLGTQIEWTLPEGFKAGPIVWPTPARIPLSGLVNFGYEDEAVLLTQITPPAGLPASGPLSLKADVSWLVCEKQCVPGEATLTLTLPAAQDDDAGPNPAHQALFAKARERVPQPAPWPVRFAASEQAIELAAGSAETPAGPAQSATFFPFDESLIENAADQVLGERDGALTLSVKRSTLQQAVPSKIEGLLVLADASSGRGAQAYSFSADPIEGRVPAVALAGGATAGGSGAGTSAAGGGPAVLSAAGPGLSALPLVSPGIDGLTLVQAALLAFLGGLILNLMPCVFPVLSIKVLSLVKHGTSHPGQIRWHGLAYTAGVLVSFLALAAVLMAVRAGGAEIGWGFQLQSPIVVALLAYVLFAMGLSLSGAVHFGASLAGAGDGLARRPGLSGSFFTGVLATVVATPCTAPFMGVAVGFALTQPALVGLAVFLALGFGLALPFLALCFAPGLQKRLPRPGVWMERLKQVLAFPVYATAAWLVWVLSQQVGQTGLAAALAGFVLVGFAAWLLGIGQQSGTRGAVLARGLALASVAAVALLLHTVQTDPAASGPGAVSASARANGVEPFTQARLDALRAEGRPVFVNMTAAWCITCMVNEKVAISREPVQAALADRNIAYLKGDWTNQNPEITRILAQFGRSGVPLYLLYPPSGEPVVLPQLLTEAIVLDELGRVAAAPTTRKQAGLLSRDANARSD